MTLALIGSAAYDTIETPVARRERVPGGSGVYAATAASFFTKTLLTGVVGEDWQDRETSFLKSKGIDTAGLEIRKDAKTLFWSGRYFDNMNQRETLEIELNVMGLEYHPVVPESFKDAPFIFLANGGPAIQNEFRRQFHAPKLVVADTMDFYINTKQFREELLVLLKTIDGLIINDGEAHLLTGESNCIAAGKKVLEMGPKFVIIKKGEHGALYISTEETAVIPAFPLDQVEDPTGAGDSFAGGFMGYLAQKGACDFASIKEALAYGTVMGSFCIQGFSLERFAQLTRPEIDQRFAQLRKMVIF